MEEIKIRFKKLKEEAQNPVRGYPGDACKDLFATKETVIEARKHGEVDLGIAVEIPYGYEMTFRARSSFGKKGIQIHPGTIDAGYRGPLSVFVYNHTDKDYVIEKGDKVVQVAIRPIMDVSFEEVKELTESERGEKGFGSSGK